MSFIWPPNPTPGQRVTGPYGEVYQWDAIAWSLVPGGTGGGGGGDFPEAPGDGRIYGRNGQLASWLPVVPAAGGTMTGILQVNPTAGSTQPAQIAVGGQGISYLAYGAIGANIAFAYSTGTLYAFVGGTAVGPFATQQWVSGNYLPTSGGILNGDLTMSPGTSLNWRSTGTPTTRAAQDRTAEVRNVKDFGAKGDGTTDDTVAIQNAMASGAGLTVYFPAGTYKVSGFPTIIPSHTRVVGEGYEVSVIRPNGLTPWEFPDGQDVIQVFAGHLYAQLGPWAITPTPPGGTYDTDIAIEGLGFDFTTQQCAVASFMFAQRVSLARIKMWGPAVSYGSGGVRIIACDRVTMRDSIGENVMQMLDCWGGTTRVKISNLDVLSCPGGGNGGVFNLQGVGSNNTPAHSWQYQATNINVQINGGSVFFLDSQGGGSITSDVLLDNINIVAASGSNQPIIGRGLGGRIKIHNMNCTALDGAAWATPILIGGFFSYVDVETGPNKISTTLGSNLITINFANGTDAGVGNYVSISGAGGNPVVGNGLSLLFNYKIVSTSNPANNLNYTVVCDARANATATGPIAATTSIIGYHGCFHNCELNGITFDGAQTAGQPVINIAGNGHQISNLNVTTNYGTGNTSPQYSVLIATDGSSEPSNYVTPRAISIDNVEGAPGAGPVPAGHSGDTLVSWNPYAPTPVRLNINGLTAGLAMNAGISFGSTTVSSHTDFSKHIALYGGLAGINISSDNNTNYASYAVHNFMDTAGNSLVQLGPGGVGVFKGNLSLGATLAASSTDFSHHINLYNNTFGICVDNNANLCIGSQAGCAINLLSGSGIVLQMVPSGVIVENTLTVGGALHATGAGTFDNGIAFNQNATGTDVSKHISLNGGFGFNYDGSNINYISWAAHLFWCQGSEVGYINSATIAMPSFTIGVSGAPTITGGPGAPSGTQPSGSIYLRTAGATGTRLYVSAGGGTWAAVAGV